MKFIKRITFFYFLNIIMFSSYISAAGTESCSFLKIDIGARPLGMGGVFCAIADDVNAMLYNPAGLEQINRTQLTATHNQWIQGVNSEFIGLAFPLGKHWAMGLMGSFLLTKLEKRDIYGAEEDEDFSAGGSVAGISLAKNFGNLSLGLNFKSVQEYLDDMSDASQSLDIGVMYKLSKLKLGFTAQNIGGRQITLYKEGFDLPSVIKMGGSYKLTKKINLGIEINKLKDKTDTRIGSEISITETFFIRAGYKLSPEINTGSGISYGLGLGVKNLRIDYAALPFGELGNTSRISLVLMFGKTGFEKIKEKKPQKPRTQQVPEKKGFIFCTECGAKNSSSSKFCTECGAPLTTE